MAKTTHSQRVLHGRLGAYTLRSRYGSAQLVRPAREAFWSKFEREVGPDGLLTPAERTRRAGMARKAYFTRLAIRSARVRAQRATQSTSNGT